MHYSVPLPHFLRAEEKQGEEDGCGSGECGDPRAAITSRIIAMVTGCGQPSEEEEDSEWETVEEEVVVAGASKRESKKK